MTNEGIAPVQPSHAKTSHDGLPWPGGRTLGNVAPGEFTSALMAWGIPGASHANGRSANAEAYAKHIQRIRTEGAQAAENAFMAEAAAK
ncbi:hypothetical protein KMZ68_13835 [Bradyrhizobium sediminis]|uniref:Uncharacterized protein n=1 Tax=Bradyrhizobium sediminis TaxID=2840469 RepID=A0A975RQ39_9BRAD|nr:hypothetical protein [Bradyrhizobium sediminis]QWG16125.1 hypothetical protein KMZ68_13835 [Bradyrhizobium sediminis]